MLHVFPADAINLPDHRRRHGFDNLGFRFADYGLIWDGKCVAIAPLPEYEITAIRTGQNLSGKGELWRADLPPMTSPPPTLTLPLRGRVGVNPQVVVAGSWGIVGYWPGSPYFARAAFGG